VIDGRLERIHPEILFLGDTLDIKRLSDVANVGGVILQQGKIIERETIQVLLRSDVRKRIDEDPPLSSPREVRHGEEVFLLLEKGTG
jgi:hypothetical protein